MTCFCSVCFPEGMIKSDWFCEVAMRTSPRSLALVLTSLLLVSLTPAFPVAAEDEAGRATGTEEVSFQPLSSEYYDRGGDITFTVTAKNLDPNTEYTLDWEICDTEMGYDCHSSYASTIGGSGSIDLGSGNMLSVTTITYTDPGISYEYYDSVADEYGYYNGISNNSLVFSAELNVQGVPLDENTSDPFVMGGELSQYSQIYEVSNVLKNMNVDVGGYFYLDHNNWYLLEYTLTCNLYEDGVTTPADSISLDFQPYDNFETFSIPVYDEYDAVIDGLVPTATSGDHYVECELVRDIDNSLVGTLTTNTFEVIDADITGNEEVSFQSMSSEYYDRTDDSTTTTITFDIDTEHLYDGTEYTLEWQICDTEMGYDCHSSYGDSIGGSGQITFIATASGTHSETVTYTDPGISYEYYDSVADEYGYYNGISNNSMVFNADLHVQGVPLDKNTSDPFVMGGELSQYSQIYEVSNVLKNMNVDVGGYFYLDHNNWYLLEYTLTCNLYEDGVTTPADSISLDFQPYDNFETFSIPVYDEYDAVIDGLVPTATSGDHYVECELVRDIDNSLVGTLTTNTFEVIDADITGNEEVSFQSMSSEYYDRTDDSTTTTITFDIDTEHLYDGTEYTLDWQICDTEMGYDCHSSYGDSIGGSGQITFIATASGTHSETVTYTDPGISYEYYDSVADEYGYYNGISNNSLVFSAELNVQGVPLDENTSDPFVMGGELSQYSQIYEVSNVLKNMNVDVGGYFYLDHNNWYLLEYTLTCNLYEDGVTTPADSISLDFQPYDNFETFSIPVYDEYDAVIDGLVPTATSGDHYVECELVRDIDNSLVGTLTTNTFEVIDDTSNQDDATVSVTVNMHPTESWGTVVIDAIDLDAGQEYTVNWVVEDHASGTPVMMMQNDHIWVAGNDGTHTYELSFHDLADTTDACITVVFSAGDTELQTVSGVCWASASTADGDGDGVYDKDDLCPNTSAGATVQADGCTDGDGDGFDSDLEISCGTDPNDATSMPTDLDSDGTCDALDLDTDGDGYLDADEVVAGTDPFDATSKPANALPTCAIYYSLEVDGIPTTFEGDAAIPALSGATAQAGVDSLVPPVITVPKGSYYITAHCIDTDGDDITVTVNDVTMGPIAGEVSAGAIIVIGEDVDETVDVTISWTDGTETLTAIITVELDGDAAPTSIPGFTGLLASLSVLIAFAFIARREV